MDTALLNFDDLCHVREQLRELYFVMMEAYYRAPTDVIDILRERAEDGLKDQRVMSFYIQHSMKPSIHNVRRSMSVLQLGSNTSFLSDIQDAITSRAQSAFQKNSATDNDEKERREEAIAYAPTSLSQSRCLVSSGVEDSDGSKHAVMKRTLEQLPFAKIICAISVAVLAMLLMYLATLNNHNVQSDFAPRPASP